MKGPCSTPGCASYAINPHLHGRDPGVDLDLCDACYWRKRALDWKKWPDEKPGKDGFCILNTVQGNEVRWWDGTTWQLIEDWRITHFAEIPRPEGDNENL